MHAAHAVRASGLLASIRQNGLSPRASRTAHAWFPHLQSIAPPLVRQRRADLREDGAGCSRSQLPERNFSKLFSGRPLHEADSGDLLTSARANRYRTPMLFCIVLGLFLLLKPVAAIVTLNVLAGGAIGVAYVLAKAGDAFGRLR